MKPRLDVRTDNEIASRRTSDAESKDFTKFGSYPAQTTDSAEELTNLIQTEQPNILGIDEAQFFDPWLVDFVADLLRDHNEADLTVLVAGLDMDAWGRPFGIMPQLMAMADEVQKETAICFRCELPAMFTQKLVSSNQQVEVGDFEIYEARCRVCHTLPGSD